LPPFLPAAAPETANAVSTAPGPGSSGPGHGADAGNAAGVGAPEAMSSEPNHYRLLGVPYTASRAEISRAYRDAVRKIHPDAKRPEQRAAAEELTKRLNVAWTTLSDPERRRQYDATIRADLVQDQIMSRYVGGFYPAGGGGADPFAPDLRREETAGERREKQEANRTAFVTLVSAFAAFALIVIVLVLLWSGLAALLRAAR